MASSEDFKKYIQAGKLTEALALAMSTAVKLQITTRVLEDEDMALDKALAKTLDKDSAPGDRLRTNVNMVEGKITNEVGEQFTGKNPYKDLKQIHLEQVKEAPKIIQNNLKSLQKLFRLLVAVGQQQLPTVAPVTLSGEYGERRVLSPATPDPTIAAAAIALAIPAAGLSPVDPVAAYGLSLGELATEEAEPLLAGGLGEAFPVPVPASLPISAPPSDSPHEDPVTAYNLSAGELIAEGESTAESGLVPQDWSIDSEVDPDSSSESEPVGLGSHRLSSLVSVDSGSSLENSENSESSEPAGLGSHRLSSLVSVDPGSSKENRGGGFNPLAAVAGVAAAGIAAAVAIGATIAKKSPATDHESLAELEEVPQDSPPIEDRESSRLEDFTDDNEDFDEDFGDEDATVIQMATVAYSPSATYVPVTDITDIPVADRWETTTTSPTAEVESLEDTPEDTHEDWVDFGENLPVETVSQMPQDVAGVMAAALEATQSEARVASLEVVVDESPQGAIEDHPLEDHPLEDHPLEDHPEAPLTGGFGGVAGVANSEEDWGDLELEPLNSADLSSFADTQETTWEDSWEEEIDTPRNLSASTPLEVDDRTDHSWDEVEEEFDFDSPVEKVGFLDADYRENPEDDGFEILEEDDDSSLSIPAPNHLSPEISEHDPMEDIFGDLDESLLPSTEHKSSLKDLDDFAGFDLDLEEPPSPRK